jgi:phage shock protein C
MTTASQTALPLRDDTFLGVCQAIGEDFGFNPNWLRVPLAVALLWNPLAVFGVYAAAGLVVLASRLLVRNPRAASAFAKASADESASEPTVPEAANSPAETLAVAA